MRRVDSLEKTLMLGGIRGRRRRGQQRMRWDGQMASPTWWTWVWVNSGSWWWTGRPGVLRFMGSQRVGHDWATELNWMRTIMKVYIQVWLLTFMPWMFSCQINVTFLPDDFKVACLCEAKKSVSAYITGQIVSVGEILFQIWVTSVLNIVKSLLSSLGLF